MIYKALEEYRNYAFPGELHKSINMLRGLVSGIKADGTVGNDEAMELAHWCSLHANFRKRHPFNELLPLIEQAIADGVIDDEEREDILWLCRRITGAGSCDYYDDIASSIQYLHGFVHGLLADQQLSDFEIHALKNWLDKNNFLSGTYPFDELCSLATSILADEVISENERNTLLAFLSNLVEFKDSYNLKESDFSALRKEYQIDGICSLCPNVEFAGKSFVITGESYRAARAELANQIQALGGVVRSSISKKTDYLIVGNAGNPCWAFSCYGRKVETALQLRKTGVQIQIVNETDFWDAVEEVLVGN